MSPKNRGYTPVLAISTGAPSATPRPHGRPRLWTPGSQELHHVFGALRREGAISHRTRIARVPTESGPTSQRLIAGRKSIMGLPENGGYQIKKIYGK